MTSHVTVILFDVLVLLSALLIVCTLLPAIFSKAVERTPGWYSLIAGWFLFSLSYGLLIGRQEGLEEPPLGLCVMQSVLVYGVPPL